VSFASPQRCVYHVPAVINHASPQVRFEAVLAQDWNRFWPAIPQFELVELLPRPGPAVIGYVNVGSTTAAPAWVPGVALGVHEGAGRSEELAGFQPGLQQPSN
jgi:hypothetical protein